MVSIMGGGYTTQGGSHASHALPVNLLLQFPFLTSRRLFSDTFQLAGLYYLYDRFITLGQWLNAALVFRSSKRIGTSVGPRLLRGWNKNKSFIAFIGGSRGILTCSSYKYIRGVTTTRCRWEWGGGGSNQRYFSWTYQFEALTVWLKQILIIILLVWS